ncbi:MAG: hypothetical protein QOC56_2038, partial [Alphaproteobacteria bacterium]|nr:hypothetical protein [Alphaproteobacteria bacterium]
MQNAGAFTAALSGKRADGPAASRCPVPGLRQDRDGCGGVAGLHLIWPWQDRNRGFSWLKAGTFALMWAPAIWLIDQVRTEQFGPVPLGGMTYWSGLWATALLLLALA